MYALESDVLETLGEAEPAGGEGRGKVVNLCWCASSRQVAIHPAWKLFLLCVIWNPFVTALSKEDGPESPREMPGRLLWPPKVVLQLWEGGGGRDSFPEPWHYGWASRKESKEGGRTE